MSWALGEIEHLVRKAVHGAGKPWGMAEEAGWAVRWLARYGFNGIDQLLNCLNAPGGLCPIRAGMAVADSGTLQPPRRLPGVHGPLLMLPFLSRICPADSSLVLKIGSAEVLLGLTGLVIDGEVPPRHGIDVTAFGEPLPSQPLASRIDHIPADVIARLQELAARTYAPATERSRQTGAGAGLTDND